MRTGNLKYFEEQERKSPAGKFHQFLKNVSIALGCALLAVTSFGAAEITPANPGVPLFRVFIGIPPHGGGKGMTFDEKRPLLTVRAVRELGLGRDDKSVQIKLMPDDAQELARLTRKYDKGFLLFEAQGRVLTALHVAKAIQNGRLGFKHPQDAVIAEYLRKRFRIGEFQ